MKKHPAGREDPRASSAYTVSEVAHYLSVPSATIRSWVCGTSRFAPLIAEVPRSPTLLSFFNLTELHIISAVRRTHGVRMLNLRKAIRYLKNHARRPHDKRHPLLSQKLETDGLDLFIERYGKLTNISQEGQTAMREVLHAALKRIERDPDGVPVKLFPFTRASMLNAPYMIAISPGVSAGRPVIAGTGLATQIIAERYKAGESVSQLAMDYERDNTEIEEAIRCELEAAA